LARAGSAAAVLGLAVASSGPFAGRAQDAFSADEFSIARRDNDQLKPRISGRYVVWQDYRNLPGAPTDDDKVNADVYGRDLVANEEFKVTSNASSARPAVSGNRVVYTDSRKKTDPCTGGGTCKLDIRGYNIESGDVFDVVERAEEQDYPAIDGALVVWQDKRNLNWDIRGRDLDEERNFVVIERDGEQMKPAISGNIVVWEDYRKGPTEPDIFLKNLDTDDVRRVTDNGDSRDPDVSGDIIVFRRGSGDDQRIQRYKISTQEMKNISERMRILGGPRISGNLVVWADRRNEEDYNIWLYDLVGEAEYRVTGADKDQLAPDVSELNVVWEDGRGDNPKDIRGAHLTLPTVAVPAPPVGPPAPSGPCFFQLGFAVLRDMIASAYGDVVGACRENEWHNAINGDALQQTQGGLLVWRKADNWTAFTNGSITWLNGPCGLQTRPNPGPFFGWEGRPGSACV
jgi:beta propeller repeat protein